MKTKKLRLPAILFAGLIIAYAVVSAITCYKTKPLVAKGDFPFSITYEYKGEQAVMSGVYHCEFSSSETVIGTHERWWNGEATYDTTCGFDYPFIIDSSEDMSLSLHEHMIPGYFMGDPLHMDYYDEYNDGVVAPYVEYYDYKNNITLDETNEEEILESIGFKIIDYTYAEPIENSFSFSGIKYEADNIVFFNLLMFVFLIVCIIFVRKDKEYKYSRLDKSGVVLNFVVGIFAVPVVALMCTLFGLIGSSYEWIDQTIYNVPPFAILCLALSVVLRRKGFSKTGFFIQFGGIVAFVLVLLTDFI